MHACTVKSTMQECALHFRITYPQNFESPWSEVLNLIECSKLKLPSEITTLENYKNDGDRWSTIVIVLRGMELTLSVQMHTELYWGPGIKVHTRMGANHFSKTTHHHST